MLEYAEWSFKLSKTENGSTIRNHLENIERQTGRTPEELIPPDFPVLLETVWRIFIDLRNSTTSGLEGPNPITYEQMKSYSEITGTPISPLYAEIITKLDQRYLKVMNNG